MARSFYFSPGFLLRRNPGGFKQAAFAREQA